MTPPLATVGAGDREPPGYGHVTIGLLVWQDSDRGQRWSREGNEKDREGEKESIKRGRNQKHCQCCYFEHGGRYCICGANRGLYHHRLYDVCDGSPYHQAPAAAIEKHSRYDPPTLSPPLVASSENPDPIRTKPGRKGQSWSDIPLSTERQGRRDEWCWEMAEYHIFDDAVDLGNSKSPKLLELEEETNGSPSKHREVIVLE